MGKSETGKRGEDLALAWLSERGFRLLDRNWRSRHKEIDLVMESEERLHIIEVKTLTAPIVTQPFEKVDARKRMNLAAAARCYISQKRVTSEVQFDLVSVILPDAEIEYVPEAFFPIWNR